MKTSILFILSYLLNLHILVAQSIITDRPDQTESPTTIPKNTFQLETGILLGQLHYHPNRTEIAQFPVALLRIGLCKKLELRVANQFARASTDYNGLENFGFGDLEFGAKFQILRKENVNTNIAFLSHVILPIGDKRLTNFSFGIINRLCFAHNLSKKISFDYNLGYNYFGQSRGIATYSAVLGLELTDNIGAFVETFGEYVDFSTHFSNLDGGFTYLLKHNMQLDISYGIGLNYHMHYFSTGFSWNFTL